MILIAALLLLISNVALALLLVRQQIVSRRNQSEALSAAYERGRKRGQEQARGWFEGVRL